LTFTLKKLHPQVRTLTKQEEDKMKCCIGNKIDDPQKEVLVKKINGLALAAFLVIIGVIWLLYEGTVPRSTWVFVLGLTLIGGNVARHLYGIGICCCSTALGVILAVAGGFRLFGVDFQVVPILLILAGIGIATGIVSGKICCSGKDSDTDLSGWKPGEEKKTKSKDKE